MKKNDEEVKDLIPKEWMKNELTKRKETDEILKRNKGGKKIKYESSEEEERKREKIEKEQKT